MSEASGAPTLSGLRVCAGAARASRPLGRRAVSHDGAARTGAPAAGALEAAAQALHDARLRGPALAALAVDIARGLIGEAVSRDPAVLEAALSEALARFTRARRVLVRVHPDDLTTARRAVADWASRVEADAAEVAADPTVSRGGLWLETDRGRMDATVDTRLAALLAALQGDGGAP